VGYVFVIRDITGKIVQRQHLQRLGKIAELTSNLVVITDAKQKIEWVNPAFEHRTGWPLAEIKGKRPDGFLVSEKTDRSEMRRIGDALRAGQPVRAELQNQTRWGEDYWISKDIQPLFGNDNRIVGYVAVQTDITEMKLSHLSELQDRAVALDASGDGIATTDSGGHYVYMNASHRRMFGIEESEDICAIHWQDLLPPDVAASFMTEHWESLSAQGSWRGEINGLHRDGHLVPQEVSLTLRGKGMLSITRDISERQRLKRELQDRAVALDAAADGIAITDTSGYFTYMNAEHRHMFGIGEDEDITELHWQHLYDEAAVQRFMSREWGELQAVGSWRGVLHGLHRDGRMVSQEVSLTLHNGGILCMTRDISEQLRQAAERTSLREKLQIAQRRETIAHLASGVAHDLNNLVAVVSGSITLLEQKVADDDDASASMERIRRAADTARDLVAGLCHLGSPQGERSIHDLRDLLLEGVELLGSQRQRDHMFCTRIPDTPCPVWANVTELLQVIVNLVLNACEASGEQPNRVCLTICEDGTPPEYSPDVGELGLGVRYTLFTVSDTGMGIDPETRPKLFQKYFTTKSPNGTGLGLPIVAGILRNNAAALWLDSTPGQGTQVTVAWPVAAPESPTNKHKHGADFAFSGDLDGLNILVVDDLPDVADVLSEMLDAAGANAVAVSDSQEAAQVLQGSPEIWAALLTDLDMPEPDGRALARIAAACVPSIPTVLVTALPEAVKDGDRLFDAVLPKPVEHERLIATLRDVIRHGLN
jgi:PAS domain S-box-containing protein